MTKKKFELFITSHNKQHVFEVGSEQVLIGSAPNCQVQIQDSNPPVKVAFWVEDNALAIKIFDLKYPIKINGKKYKSAKLSESLFFKAGTIDVILSVEEFEINNTSEASLENDFEEEFDQRSEIDKEIKDLPAELPAEVVEAKVANSQEKKNEEGRLKKQIPLELEINDIVDFDISFNHKKFKPLGFEAYSQPNLDFSSYIDPFDETVEIAPQPELTKAKKGFSVHIVHMDNGTVLGEKFFSSKNKRLYLSEKVEKKNFFQVHNIGHDKQEIAFIKGDHVSIVAINGFRMVKSARSQSLEIEEKSVQLLSGEKIILTKGTSQLVIQLAPAIPLVKDANYFDFDEEMLKSVAYAWIFALFVLVNVLVSEAPVEEQKKKVVIYKVRKKETPKKEIVKSPDMPKPSPSEQEVQEKDVPTPKPIAKKVVKKTPVKPRIVERAKKRLPAPKVVTQKEVKKAAPKPAVKKEYKFEFAKKMASSLSTSKAVALKSAKDSSSLNVTNAMDSRTSAVAGSAKNSKLGSSNVKVGRMTASKSTGTSRAMGTKGLSGKTKSNTAYMEAKTKVLGSLDPALIRKIMKEHIPAFRYCYQQELLENAQVAGVFDVNFQINATGRGVRTFVKSKGDGFSKKGLTCIKRVVSRIKFPRPKGGGYVDVRQPMNFYTN